jgi:hypothetical protein
LNILGNFICHFNTLELLFQKIEIYELHQHYAPESTMHRICVAAVIRITSCSALVRILDHLSRPAPDRPRLKATFQGVGGEIDKMEEWTGRPDAVREVFALRQNEPPRKRIARRRRNEIGLKPLISIETAKQPIPHQGSGQRTGRERAVIVAASVRATTASFKVLS